MKFDFKDTQYVKMFEDSVAGRAAISYILNDPNLIKANYQFWKTYFPADPTPLPTDKNGYASVRIDGYHTIHRTVIL